MDSDTDGDLHCHYAEGSEVFKIDRLGNVIIDSAAQVETDEIESKTTFQSGWSGAGLKLYKSGSDYNLEVDNLRVRGGMDVYELTINKIRANNGSLVISAGAG